MNYQMNFHFNSENIKKSIQTEVLSLNRFVLWKKKIASTGYIKYPVNATTGLGAKSNDSFTWTTFENCLQNLDKYGCDGVGIMLGDGIIGVDLDHINEMPKNKIDDFLQLKGYKERSQSGNGIHILVFGKLNEGYRRKNGVEMYDNYRFFALTGNTLSDSSYLQDQTETINYLHQKYLGLKPTLNFNFKPKEYNSSLLNENEVLEIMMHSKQGSILNSLYCGCWEPYFPSQSEADYYFMKKLAFYSNCNELIMDDIFKQSGLYREKYNKIIGNETYGQRVIRYAILNTKDTYQKGYKK